MHQIYKIHYSFVRSNFLAILSQNGFISILKQQCKEFENVQFLKLKTAFNYLCKEGASDKDLHHHGDDQLKDEQDNGDRTLLSYAPETIANCGLGLQRKEKGSCQGLHLHYTWRMVGGGVKLWRKNRRSWFGVNKLPKNMLFPLSEPGLSHALTTMQNCIRMCISL